MRNRLCIAADRSRVVSSFRNTGAIPGKLQAFGNDVLRRVSTGCGVRLIVFPCSRQLQVLANVVLAGVCVIGKPTIGDPHP